jgi:hypothetical protein
MIPKDEAVVLLSTMPRRHFSSLQTSIGIIWKHLKMTSHIKGVGGLTNL